MVPVRGVTPDMTGLPVFIGAGKYDLSARRKNQKSFTAIYVTAGHQPPYSGRMGPSADAHEAEQAREWYKMRLRKNLSPYFGLRFSYPYSQVDTFESDKRLL